MMLGGLYTAFKAGGAITTVAMAGAGWGARWIAKFAGKFSKTPQQLELSYY